MEFFIFPEKCTACMACVLACSLHHAQRFDRKMASIQVNNPNKEREIQVRIQSEKGGGRPPCDDCRGEKEPLCVKYCVPQAIIFK